MISKNIFILFIGHVCAHWSSTRNNRLQSLLERSTTGVWKIISYSVIKTPRHEFYKRGEQILEKNFHLLLPPLKEDTAILKFISKRMKSCCQNDSITRCSVIIRNLVVLPSPKQRVLSIPLYTRFLMNALKYCLKISPIDE